MTEPQLELIPQNTIRIETALSRFPIHRLSKRGNISIEIREATEAGEVKTKWEVDYPKKVGQPGPLAYKVDTLVINRKIDEVRPAIPKILRLGSLHEIAKELGLGGDTNKIKRALRQNAGAFITAKLSYRTNDSTEKTLEADFTRYSVIFTGEKFPNGSRADAVYILLNDIYLKMLNEVPTRPLDYVYLKGLTPGAQRFYELVSYQIYAVLKHERPHARLLYSDICTRTPQTRYFDWEHVRKQMYKVHAPHLKSGYLTSVEFQQQRDEGGELDWLMLYTPGRRAQAEFREASKRPRTIERPIPTKPKNETPPSLPAATPAPPLAAASHEADAASEQLVSRLIGFHVAEATARELVRDYRKSVELQLRALLHRNTGKIKDLTSWLIKAIKENYELPEAMTAALEKEQEVQRQLAKREAEQRRQRQREALRPAYYEFLRTRAERHRTAPHGAYSAFLAREAGQRSEIAHNRLYKPKLKAKLLSDFDHEEAHLDRLREFFREPAFDAWVELHAP